MKSAEGGPTVTPRVRESKFLLRRQKREGSKKAGICECQAPRKGVEREGAPQRSKTRGVAWSRKGDLRARATLTGNKPKWKGKDLGRKKKKQVSRRSVVAQQGQTQRAGKE